MIFGQGFIFGKGFSISRLAAMFSIRLEPLEMCCHVVAWALGSEKCLSWGHKSGGLELRTIVSGGCGTSLAGCSMRWQAGGIRRVVAGCLGAAGSLAMPMGRERTFPSSSGRAARGGALRETPRCAVRPPPQHFRVPAHGIRDRARSWLSGDEPVLQDLPVQINPTGRGPAHFSVLCASALEVGVGRAQ